MAFLMMIILLLGAGCGTSGSTSTSPNINGLIYSIHANTILVVEGIDTVDIAEDEWHGKSAYYTRITTKTVIQSENGDKLNVNDLNKGDHVLVWHTGVVLESYPMQVEAVKIVVATK